MHKYWCHFKFVSQSEPEIFFRICTSRWICFMVLVILSHSCAVANSPFSFECKWLDEASCTVWWRCFTLLAILSNSFAILNCSSWRFMNTSCLLFWFCLEGGFFVFSCWIFKLALCNFCFNFWISALVFSFSRWAYGCFSWNTCVLYYIFITPMVARLTFR